MEDCLFCKIAKGEIPAKVAYEDEQMLVFHDIAPKAPIHLIGITRNHYDNIVDFARQSEEQELGYFIRKLTELGTEAGDFKLVFNTGANAGQTVHHIHGHILANPEGKLEIDGAF
jgi:histidine triad (HIT) family protein